MPTALKLAIHECLNGQISKKKMFQLNDVYDNLAAPTALKLAVRESLNAQIKKLCGNIRHIRAISRFRHTITLKLRQRKNVPNE